MKTEAQLTAEIQRLQRSVEEQALELEAKNRELEIEAALERVRARAMSMQKSEELRELVFEFYKQIHPFGIAKWGFEIKIAKEDKSGFYCWISPPGARIQPEGFEIPTLDHWVLKKYWSTFEQQTPSVSIEVSGDDKRKLGVLLLGQSDMKNLPEDVKTNIKETEYVHFSVAAMRFGLLKAVDMEPVLEKDFFILQRFAKVFEQTYTRFLDLQKAEAQAREAEIELALERVRSRTMAMHKSEELAEVAALLFDQLKILGAQLWTAGFAICKKEEVLVEKWMSSPIPGQMFNHLFVPYNADHGEQRMYDTWKNQEALHSYAQGGKELKDIYDHLMEIPSFKANFQKVIDFGRPLPVWQKNHVSAYKYGYLLIITEEEFEEENIFPRFAKVFEQTYTRFLDLEKAEAQAREAQIEVALEKVRSASMAMHKSEELVQVVRVIDKEILGLGIETDGTQIFTDFSYKEKGLNDWFAKEGHDFLEKFHVPYLEHSLTKRLYDALAKGVDFYSDSYSKDEKNEFLKLIFTYSDFRTYPKESQDLIYNAPGLVRASVLSKNSILIFQHYDLKEFSKEEEDIFKRFGKVFEQAYTRFLDLQKAEAQAREAQIEVALEKVRSASMAMHKSEELVQVVRILDKQILGLGIEAWATNILTDFANPEKGSNTWLAVEGQDYLEKFHVPFIKHPIFKKLLTAVRKGVDFYTETYSKADKDEFFKLLFKFSDFKSIPKERQNFAYSSPGMVRVHVLFKNSILTFQRLDLKEFSKEEEEIFKRFGKVFEQAYTRFLDLEKAEAQAREAKIEAGLEKVRAASMAMHKSEELGSVASALYVELQNLEMSFDTMGVLLKSDKPKDLYLWVTSIDGSYDNLIFWPYVDMPSHNVIAQSWGKGKVEEISFSKPETRQFFSEYFKLDGVPQERKKALKSVEVMEWIISVNKLSGLNLVRLSTKPFDHDEKDIIQRFSRVFEQSYTRFLDLQKAEAQAREAQIEVALERVRSASMAMQKQEDLLEVINLLSEQLVKLGVQMEFANFSNGNQLSEWNLWIYTVTGDESAFTDYIHFPEVNHPLFNRTKECIQDFKNGKADFSKDVYDKEEKDTFLDYSLTKTVYKDLPSEAKDYLYNKPGLTRSIIFFKDTSVGIGRYNTIPFSDEEDELLKRFANAFNLAYTRFLDLQKAEAQAREAQIEVALERVRSASMAMHRSDDLLFVIRAVHEQISELGIKVDASNFLTFIENSRDLYLWAITNTHTYQQKLRVTYIDFGITKKMWDAWEKGDSFVEFQADADEMHRWWNTAFEVSELSHTPPNRREIILSAPGHTSIVAKGKTCALQLHRYNLEIFTTQEHDILRRLATVFEQSYTRFLDLQKAEAQARESQIEASLERVRASMMAMHRSDELLSISTLISEEMMKMGVIDEYNRVAFALFDDEKEELTLWITELGGDRMNKSFVLPNDFEPSFVKTFEIFHKLKPLERKEHNHIRTYIGEELIAYTNRFIKAGVVSPEIMTAIENGSLPNSWYDLVSFFAFGSLTIGSFQKITDEQKDVAKRFARVFEQTYTRFLDLQKAEAQAREAIKQSSLDRVRGEIASMRDAKDLERITPLVWSELKSLGVPFFRCGVMLVNEDEEMLDFYLSNPQGEALAALRLDFDNSEITRKGVAHWRKKETYIEHWNQEQFLTFMRSLMDQGQISNPTTYQGGEKPPTALTLQFVPFAQGMLYVGSEIDLNAEELDLVKALGKSLSVAYARYEDFTKLDLAKAKAEKALNDLKAAQEQLVQQEKLASLGQLTAGIAHEIKNPLNFVNNFSDLSRELIEEVFAELENLEASATKEEIIAILQDVQSNLTKVHEHGTRADSIVTSMLQHSRASGSKREPKAFNPLVKEFVNLSFHGMRAGKYPINVDIDLQLDPKVGDVTLISEDFSRVILNLCNNAFDAMRDKLKTEDGRRETGDGNSYLPKLTVKTALQKDKVLLSIADNGGGIPEEIKDKILQPFFTTKKGTEGTGLGLSITNDIVKAHGGELKLETQEGVGSTFMMLIPVNNS
ncbi:MAG: ATP-binding protein [Algoriphagus sp.]|uniref:sensor histidine kinase n=1 Tax=Algoriphagus sp. TaxID=1872435 RepID=UPI00260BBBF0|nr:ATP-binding protein [Algoriphagus sp.]MDG1277819.1 ATP-binding protein [Algoriphagus sp.]